MTRLKARLRLIKWSWKKWKPSLNQSTIEEDDIIEFDYHPIVPKWMKE